MVQWQSLYQSTILYWPTDSPYSSLLSSHCPTYSTYINFPILHWPTDSPNITLLILSLFHLIILISVYYTLICPMTVYISLCYLLMAHWQSLYQSTKLYWPTDSPYNNLTILCRPTDSPLSTVNYTQMAHWLSLRHSTAFSTGPQKVPIALFYTSTGPLTVPLSLNYTLLAHLKVPISPYLY